MPPRPRLRPISISFDAQDTLVRVVNGVEHQYRQSLLDVLHRRGISSDAMRFSHARVKAAIVAGMTEVVRADRAVFAEREAARRGCCADDVDVHEMPLGGRDRHSTEHFWSRALMQTFAHAPLYDECAPHVRDAMRLLMRDEDAWSEFTREIIFERFGTRRVWEWMPASLNALRELRAWNIGQIERAATATTTTTTTTADEDVCGEVIAVLAQPPVIVTNNDARIRRVVEELLQDAPRSAACSNTLSAPTPSSATTTSSTHADALIGGVITCYDVPLVKPSPLGILACARAAQLDDSELCFHLHVGDAREDHVASARAGCRFLRCDPMRGVEWEHLRDAIASMEHAMMMEHAKRC